MPAVRNWRQGEAPSGENRFKLAQLVATCDLLEGEFLIEDVAGWLEMPFRSEVPLTPADAYGAERLDLVVDWAANRIGEVELLDALMPDWRKRFESGFEVFKASDGMMALRVRR